MLLALVGIWIGEHRQCQQLLLQLISPVAELLVCGEAGEKIGPSVDHRLGYRLLRCVHQPAEGQLSPGQRQHGKKPMPAEKFGNLNRMLEIPIGNCNRKPTLHRPQMIGGQKTHRFDRLGLPFTVQRIAQQKSIQQIRLAVGDLFAQGQRVREPELIEPARTALKEGHRFSQLQASRVEVSLQKQVERDQITESAGERAAQPSRHAADFGQQSRRTDRVSRFGVAFGEADGQRGLGESGPLPAEPGNRIDQRRIGSPLLSQVNRRAERKGLVDQIVLPIDGGRVRRLQSIVGGLAQIAQLILDDCQFQETNRRERMVHPAIELQRADEDLLGFVEVFEAGQGNAQGNPVPRPQQAAVAMLQRFQDLKTAGAERVEPRSDSLEHPSAVQRQRGAAHDFGDVNLTEFRILNHAALLSDPLVIQAAEEHLEAIG